MALKPFNSIGGFSVGEIPSNVILANGDVTTTNITTTGVSNLNSIANVKILGGTAGQVIVTDGEGNLTFATNDTAQISNGSSSVKALANSNVITAVNGSNIFTVTATGATLTGNIEVTGIKTDNIYYANGQVWDLQQAAGENNQIQFNEGDNFAASANFTFNPTTNLLNVAGNIAGQNVNAGNLLTANFVSGTLTTAAQPNITSVGNLTGLVVEGNANVTGNLVTGGTINSTGNITAPYIFGNIVGNISGNLTVPGSNTEVIFNNNGQAGASNAFTFNNDTKVLDVNGNVDASYFIGNGSQLTGINATSITSGTLDAGRLSGSYTIDINGNATTAGTVTTAAQPNITSVGTLTSLAVTGNVSAGNVSATNLTGTLTTAAQPNITSVGTLGSLAVTGNISAGNVSATDVTGTTLGGTLTTAAQPNITSVGTLTSLGVSGDISGANLVANTKLVTDSITNKSGNLVVSSNTNILLSTTGVVDAGSSRITSVATPTSDADAATKLYVDNLVSSGIHYHPPVRVESPTALNATYNNGTAGVGATLTNAGANVALSIDGISLNSGDRVLVYTQADAKQNGVYVVTTVGSGSTAWVLTRSSDTDTYAPSTNDGLDEGSYFFVQEGVTGAGESYVCSTPGTIVFGTTNINFAQFSKAPIYTAGTGLGLYGNNEFYLSNTTVTAGSYGNGDRVATFTVNAQGQLTAAGNTAITANAANLTGDTLSSSVVNSSLTSVGTLGSLAVTGNITSGNVYANAGTVGANVVTANVLTGTLSTAAQPNITSVGTLTSLNVTGNVAAGNVSGTNGAFTTVAGTLTTAAQPNITSVGTLTSLSVTGNVAAGNVSGTNGAFTTVAGTLTTAAQPNVTSVGTLTSLNVTGNVAAGNVSATNANVATANVSGNVIIGSTTTSAASVTTTATTPNQTIAQFPVSGTTGVEFLVKGVDATGSKYSVAKLVAVTDGTSVDYTIFSTVNIGTTTGTGLQIVVDGGNVKLQVTPSSSNSTVWTTQYNLV